MNMVCTRYDNYIKAMSNNNILKCWVGIYANNLSSILVLVVAIYGIFMK